jgi:heme A synthase
LKIKNYCRWHFFDLELHGNTAEASSLPRLQVFRQVMIAAAGGCSIGYFMAAYASADGTNPARDFPEWPGCFGSSVRFVRDRAEDQSLRLRHGAAAADVMLHLRSRYVSKAAILTIMVLSIPVENRSPA